MHRGTLKIAPEFAGPGSALLRARRSVRQYPAGRSRRCLEATLLGLPLSRLPLRRPPDQSASPGVAGAARLVELCSCGGAEQF